MISWHDALYAITPAGPVPRDVQDALATMPGVQHKKRAGHYLVPLSAVALVQQWLPGAVVSQANAHPPVLPRAWDETADAELAVQIRECPQLQSWLVDGGGRFTLLPFQRQAIWWAIQWGGGLLVEAPGAGKTVQSICAAALGPPGPVLVITKSGVVEQFRRSIEAFTGCPALELRPPSKERVKDGERLKAADLLRDYFASTSRPFVVVGWGSLRAHLDTLLSVGQWATAVADESHYGLKNHERIQYTAGDRNMLTGREDLNKAFLDTTSCAAWRIALQSTWRLAITATPIPDRRRDLWGQLSFVAPHAWGETWKRFVFRYCDAQQGAHGGLDTSGASNTEELEHRLSYLMHKVPQSVSHAELPPLRMTTCVIPPRDQDKVTGFKVQLSQAGKAAQKGGKEARQKLRELQLLEAAARKRTAALTELNDRFEDKTGKGKVIVFTGRHIDCADLAERVRKAFPHVDVFAGVVQTEDGGLTLPSRAERQTIQDAYMAHPGPCCLVATGQAWGTGLDLHDTDLLLVVMLPWAPGDFVQWIGRVQRLGMNRPVEIRILVAEGTVDERVSLVLSEKTPDIERLVEQEELEGAREILLGIDDPEAVLDGLSDRGEGMFAEDFWKNVDEGTFREVE